jgi:YHS domain-containing protein
MNLHPLSEENNEAITVCGGRIKDPNIYPNALYHGERVYFCTRACLRAFEADPDPFMAGEIEHPEED